MMRGKPCFFVHSGTAFVALLCTWLVPMTCCSYNFQDSKKSGRNSLFPEASWMVFSGNRTEHLLLLLRISSQWTRQTVDPTWSSAALAISSPRQYFFTTAFVGFPTFFCERTAWPNQRNKESYMKENCSCRARTRPKFSHFSLSVQTPNPLVQALES